MWSIYVASEGTTRDRRTMRLARYQLRSSRLGGGEATASAPHNAFQQKGAGETRWKAKENMVAVGGGKIVFETAGRGGAQPSGGGTWGQ